MTGSSRPSLGAFRYRSIFAFLWVVAFIAVILALIAFVEFRNTLVREALVIIGVAAATLFGVYLILHIIRPVTKLSTEINQVMAGTRDKVGVEGDDELSAIATTFNLAMTRLRETQTAAAAESAPTGPPRWERNRRFSIAAAVAKNPRLLFAETAVGEIAFGMARRLTGAAAGILLLPGEGSAKSYYHSAAGFGLAAEPVGDFHPDESARAFLSGGEVPLILADPGTVPAVAKLLPDPSLSNWLALPLWYRADLIGLIFLHLKDKPAPDDEARRALRRLAGETASALALVGAYRAVRDRYRESVGDLAAVWETAAGLPAGFAEQTAKLAVKLGKAAGLTAAEIETVELAAWLHELGEVGVSECLRETAAEELRAGERKALEGHPFLAAELINTLELRHEVIPLILNHHERWDGGGYPEKMAGERIPIGARVLAVAAAWGRLLAEHEGDRAAARAALGKMAGKQLDPVLVDRLIKSLHLLA